MAFTIFTSFNSATISQVKPSFIHTMSMGSDSCREPPRRSHRGSMPPNWTQPLCRQSLLQRQYVHTLSFSGSFPPHYILSPKGLPGTHNAKMQSRFQNLSRFGIFQALTIFKGPSDAHNVQMSTFQNLSQISRFFYNYYSAPHKQAAVTNRQVKLSLIKYKACLRDPCSHTNLSRRSHKGTNYYGDRPIQVF